MAGLKFPTIKSLEGQTLYYLLTGHRISHLEFQNSTRSYCLRGPIFNLRQDGWPIDDCWNSGGISEVSGRRTKFKKYFIKEDDLKAIRVHFGERLDSFLELAKGGHPQTGSLEGGIQ